MLALFYVKDLDLKTLFPDLYDVYLSYCAFPPSLRIRDNYVKWKTYHDSVYVPKTSFVARPIKLMMDPPQSQPQRWLSSEDLQGSPKGAGVAPTMIDISPTNQPPPVGFPPEGVPFFQLGEGFQNFKEALDPLPLFDDEESLSLSSPSEWNFQ